MKSSKALTMSFTRRARSSWGKVKVLGPMCPMLSTTLIGVRAVGSPDPFVLLRSDNPQKDLVDPAVKGTTTVLRSVTKSNDTVKRVVLTSSVAGKQPASALNILIVVAADHNVMSTGQCSACLRQSPRSRGLCFVYAAIMKMKGGPLKGKVFTDEDWNDEATVNEGSYEYSKVGHCQSKWAT